jgi:hypothetical protein
MGEAVYMLCALTSFTCTWLLVSHYRKTKVPILFWSALAFLCFTVNNVLLFVDLVLVPQMDLSIARTACALAGVGILLGGLIHQNT